MVLEPKTARYAYEEAETQRGWTPSGVPVTTLDFEGEWIVRSHIGWSWKQNILYMGVETSPSTHVLKPPKRTISVSGGLRLL